MELEERIYSLNINEDKQEEIIALASIFEGDLEIVEINDSDETIINIQIHPSEGGVKLSDQELRVTLTLEIIYGDKQTNKTKLSIRNCKGLSNKRICEIESVVVEMQNQEGTVFDIIDTIKEKIDEMNQSPDGECPICLFPFERTNLYKVRLLYSDCIFRLQRY